MFTSFFHHAMSIWTWFLRWIQRNVFLTFGTGFDKQSLFLYMFHKVCSLTNKVCSLMSSLFCFCGRTIWSLFIWVLYFLQVCFFWWKTLFSLTLIHFGVYVGSKYNGNMCHMPQLDQLGSKHKLIKVCHLLYQI